MYFYKKRLDKNKRAKAERRAEKGAALRNAGDWPADQGLQREAPAATNYQYPHKAVYFQNRHPLTNHKSQKALSQKATRSIGRNLAPQVRGSNTLPLIQARSADNLHKRRVFRLIVPAVRSRWAVSKRGQRHLQDYRCKSRTVVHRVLFPLRYPSSGIRLRPLCFRHQAS